jgi:hypothetical protein
LVQCRTDPPAYEGGVILPAEIAQRAESAAEHARELQIAADELRRYSLEISRATQLLLHGMLSPSPPSWEGKGAARV